jgi:alpha-galactosidase
VSITQKLENVIQNIVDRLNSCGYNKNSKEAVAVIGYHDGIFSLSTECFSYIFRIAKHGHPEHLHFGVPVSSDDMQALAVKPGIGWGSSVLYDADGTCLDVLPLEWSGSGRGDYRESPLEWSLGSSDFTYAAHRIVDGTLPMSGGLPQSQNAEKTLEISFEHPGGARLLLIYSVYKTAITRRAVLVNHTNSSISVKKLMSFSLDLFGNYELTTFDGGWIAEMRPSRVPIGPAAITHGSTTGFSSNRHQPGFLISEPDCTEENGRVYGFNLI